MQQTFNAYGEYDKTNITLCNPTKYPLYSLNTARDVTLRMRYNALSELSFTIDSSVNGSSIPAYSRVIGKMVVWVENFGYFIITEVVEDTGKPVPSKDVTALSLESELMYKKLNGLTGTFKFYDPITPEGTLLQILLDLAPLWTVGTVDPELWNVYRTFDISDNNLYNFMMVEMEAAFGCIFTFDTALRTVSAKKVENATINTDIFISKDNLIVKTDLREITQEIVTAMSVFGGNDLNIRGVNPLGGNYIYNFDYFKTTDWMTQGLIDALDAWEALIAANQTTFSNQLTALSDAYNELLNLQAEYSELNSEYLGVQGVQKVLIENGTTTGTQYQETVTQLANLTVLMESKSVEIQNKEDDIQAIILTLQNITALLDMDANFTPEQLAELEPYIVQNTYQNKNIITTDNMTSSEVQAQALLLYNDAMSVLAKVSVPRFEFTLNTANFIYLPEYEAFTQQVQLGAVVTVNPKDDIIVQTVLLEIEISPTDPTSFQVIFSNRLRLDNGSFIYSDLFNQTNRASSSVDFKGGDWSNWATTYKDTVSTFITSSLDASVNNLVNADNQEILINQNGLQGKQFLTDTNTYSPNQVWLTSSTLAFTRDGWQTASLAIGKISVNAQEVYGVVADAIVGRLLAGNQLTITNENNNFTLDANGAVLNNATFVLQDGVDLPSSKTKIFITPVGTNFSGFTVDPGITIFGNTGGTWTKRFWVDNTGSVNFTGNLTGASGTFSGTISATTGSIGGLTINSQGIQKDSNNYIRSNGDLKWGALTITGSTATFNGNIYANNLKDNGGSSVFNSSGIMSGSRLFGGTASNMDLNWDGLRLEQAGNGAMFISGSVSIFIQGGSAQSSVGVSNSGVVLRADNGTFAYGGLSVETGYLKFKGNILPDGSLSYAGYTNASLPITTPAGTRYLRFRKGILYGYSTTP